MTPLWTTLAILAAAALFEGVAAGREPRKMLETLRQPRWSPPFPVWLAIGLLFYAVFGAILYRLLDEEGRWATVALALVVLILIANAAWNYLLFRRRDLRASLRALPPYGLLVAALLLILVANDRAGALILVPYLLYLPFALAWMRALVRLNGVGH